MRKLVSVAGFAAIVLAGCATVPPVVMTTTFNPAEVAWASAVGTNTINGNAVLRTVGGEVRTCAGFEAVLSPVSAYSTEMMGAQFGSSTRGYTSYWKEVTSDPRYRDTNRRTTCDSQGNFRFDRLPDGEYFVITSVTWSAPTGGRYSYMASQGGGMMQRVSVAGGETKSIVLTQ